MKRTQVQAACVRFLFNGKVHPAEQNAPRCEVACQFMLDRISQV